MQPATDDVSYLIIAISGLVAVLTMPWYIALVWAVAALVWTVSIEANSREARNVGREN